MSVMVLFTKTSTQPESQLPLTYRLILLDSFSSVIQSS